MVEDRRSDADKGTRSDATDPTGGASTDGDPRDDAPPDEHEALATIARGAVVTGGAVSVQRALTTATEFVLTRGLGPATYGVYAYAWRITQVLVQLVTVGGVPALQRFLPAARADSDRRSRITGLAYLTTVVTGLLMAVGIWIAAPWINERTVGDPAFIPALRLFGPLIGLLGLVSIAAAVFRAIGSARGEVLYNKLLRPGVRLVGAVTAVALGYSVVGVVGGILLATLLFVGVGVPMSIRATGIRPRLRGVRRDAVRFYNHAGPVAMSSFGKVFQNRIDVLLVGALLTSVAAGVYNVVLVLISLAWIPLLSFNQLLPPVASELYAADRIETLNAVYASVTRLILTSVLPVIAVLGVYGGELLGVFGSAYVRGYSPLVVYLGGVFVGSAVGATGWLLMMTDHQYARMVLDWFLAVLNVVLTYLFIVRYGLVGAALGTSLAIAVQNAIQVLLLRRFEDLWPFDRTFLTPLSAGSVMIACMLVVREALPGMGAVVVGTVVGLLAYLVTLRLLGIDPRDRLVITTLATEYRCVLSTWVPFGRR